MITMNNLTQEERELIINIINTVPFNGTYKELQPLLKMVANILTKLTIKEN